MYARSQMPSVSRTLWSVMSTPMPRSLRNLMMRWMSSTAIGSTPAKAATRRRCERSGLNALPGKTGSVAGPSFLPVLADAGALAGLHGHGDPARFLAPLAGGHLVKIRALVDEDVGAGHLVAAAVDARVVEQLKGLLALVDLDAQRLAVHPLALLLAFLRVQLLLEAHRRAGGAGELVALGVLAHDDALGAHRDCPLGQDHVALVDRHALDVVRAHAVRLDLGGLVAICLLGPRGQNSNQKYNENPARHFFGSKRPRTSAIRLNTRDSASYSMPRPVRERESSTIVTSRSVRPRARPRPRAALAGSWW